MRHRRILAYTLILTLIASVIAGAMGVSIQVANADTPSSTYAYIGDFIAACKDMDFIKNNASYLAQVESYENYVNSNFNSEFFVAIKQGNNYCFASYYNQDASHRFALWSSQTLFGAANQAYYYRTSYLMVSGDNNICALSLSTSSRLNQESGALNFTSSSIQTSCCPNKANFDISGREVYFNQNVYSQYGATKVYDYNLLEGSSAPVIFDFDLYTFWLGSRLYLTISDQLIIRELYGNELMEYVLFCTYDNESNSEDFITKAYTFLDCALLQYTGIESNLSNVSPNGVYAIDITEIGYNRISDAIIEDYTEDFAQVGQAANVPYVIFEESPEPGTNGTPDNYTTMWQEFNTYVTNYNLTPIVPDALSTSLFGVSGLQCYPVSIDVPEEVWVSGGNLNHDDLSTWKWWTNQTNLGINFELMDTCIISSGEFLYTLVYFYDSTLQVAFMPVQNVEITELFTMFDCVIIVPDDKGCLDKTTWYEEMLQAIGQTINLNVTFGNNIAISGTSSLGVEYLPSAPVVYNDIITGYCFVTPKGIQRQQLFAFSDGITKVYQLMVDYVESEDNWKSSFLTFTSSLFYGINTIDGSLSKILAAINSMKESIEHKLDTLIQNTSEEEPSHWFPSLWLWVLQFKPSNNDFSVALDVYDDNWDNIPLLPAPSPVPALPTIQGG